MKKTLKRTLTLLLAVLMVMSVSPTVYVAAADEYEPLNDYVLNYGVNDDEYTGPNIQYFSAYLPYSYYDGMPSFDPINIYSMYNTVTGEVIPVYCTDIKVGARTDNHYHRLNLENSTYASDTAELLRAIMLNGFYLVPIVGETTEGHNSRVAAKLQEIGTAVGIPDLTIGEAIAGTQTAIWKAAHGSRLEFTDFAFSISNTKSNGSIKYYDICTIERENGHVQYSSSTKPTPECDEYLNARIKTVYDYLLSLDPVPPANRVVSPLSFVDFENTVITRNDDGTCNITVTTTVDVDMTGDDYLTLSAVLNNTYYKSVALVDGVQEVELTIENVPANIAANEVTLAIDGMQTVDDVLLYEAKGGRETSQSMIGMDNSQLPVHVEVDATNERIINFYKTTIVENDGETERYPLEGISFDIYLAAELDDYLSGEVKLPEAADYAYPSIPDYTAITDENGRATVNFTRHGMPDGVYLIVEREHPAIERPIDPFYVFIPTTNANGTGYDYEITIQPKNDVKGSIRVEKDVTSLGNNKTSTNVYDNHTWIIGTNVPEDIANGKSYVISDTLDNRLDYVGNVKVNVETAEGDSVIATLVADTDYKLTVNDVDSLSDGKPSDSFSISLTRTGMGKIANSIGDNNFDNYMIRIYVDSQVNSNAEMGTEIANQAKFEYINSVNFAFNAESDKPVVYTGAVNLLKVDSGDNTKVLPGAVFEVYRAATVEEVAADGDELTTIPGYAAYMIKESFFDNAAMEGEKVQSVTSDENGKVAIYGLAHGEYYLVETKAPTGYNLLGSVVKLIVDGESHTEERVVMIENVNGVVLPSTGGIGTTAITVIGVLLMLSSCILLYIRKRRFAYNPVR